MAFGTEEQKRRYLPKLISGNDRAALHDRAGFRFGRLQPEDRRNAKATAM